MVGVAMHTDESVDLRGDCDEEKLVVKSKFAED